jgi:hypothetical protein
MAATRDFGGSELMRTSPAMRGSIAVRVTSCVTDLDHPILRISRSAHTHQSARGPHCRGPRQQCTCPSTSYAGPTGRAAVVASNRRSGLVEPPRRPVGAGEVVARDEGCRGNSRPGPAAPRREWPRTWRAAPGDLTAHGRNESTRRSMLAVDCSRPGIAATRNARWRSGRPRFASRPVGQGLRGDTCRRPAGRS